MRRIETLLAAAFERRMCGDQLAVFEDADGVGEDMDFEDAPPGGVRHAVEIAADADHAFMRGASFEPRHRLIGHGWQRFERRLLFGEGLVDDALRRGVDARIGDRVEPFAELSIQIVEIAEGAAEEKILADIAERPLDLPLRFRAIGFAGARPEAVMAGEIEQRAIVDDEAVRVFADDGGLHAVVEDLARNAAERLEGGHVAAQDALHILMQNEARPDEAGMAQDHGKEPDDALDAGRVEELEVEAGEVDLRLLSGRVSKRTSKPLGRGGRSSRSRSVTPV